jgi:predicted nucleic acid-binding Zn ribbon protein
MDTEKRSREIADEMMVKHPGEPMVSVGYLSSMIAHLEQQIFEMGGTPYYFSIEPEPVIKERKKAKRCAVCGAIMEGFRQDAVVCSDACRMIAYRKRKRAKRSG